MLNSFDILLIIEYVISICCQTMGHGTDDIHALTKVHCHCHSLHRKLFRMLMMPELRKSSFT